MIIVKLSRRNLLCLLHKLEMPGSARVIVKSSAEEDEQGEPRCEVYVNAVTDEEFYVDREPGPMHPETVQFAADLQAALEIVRAQKLRGPTPQWAIDAATTIVDGLADDDGWDIEGRDRGCTIRATAAEIIEKLVAAV